MLKRHMGNIDVCEGIQEQEVRNVKIRYRNQAESIHHLHFQYTPPSKQDQSYIKIITTFLSLKSQSNYCLPGRSQCFEWNFGKMQFYKPNLIHFCSDSQLNISVIVASKYFRTGKQRHQRNILKQSSDKTYQHCSRS